MIPPVARREPLVDEIFGRPVADPYRWLEKSDSDEVRQWSSAQEALWQEHLSELPGRSEWSARLRELLGAGYQTPPVWRGAREFFMRRSPENELGILYTRKDSSSELEILLDPLAINPAGTTTLDSWQPSKEGDQLAYQLSTGGTEESTLYVLDVDTHEIIDGPIDRARYSPIAWLPGGKAFYYVRRLAPELLKEDERQYHRRVYFHVVGTNSSEDIEIFGSGLEMTNYYGVTLSMDGRWLTLSASAGTEPRNDLWLADLHASSPSAPKFILIQSAESDAQTSLEPLRDGRILIGTNFDAPRGRICISSPKTLLSVGESAEWRDLVAEDSEAVMSGWAVLDGPLMPASMLIALWTRHTVSEITVHSLETGERQSTIPLPGLGTVTGITVRPEGGHEAWFGYTDHITPPTIYSFDGRTLEIKKYADPPGAVIVPKVFAQLVTYTSFDDTQVRMFILSPTEDATTPRPTVLYGYGGFGVGLNPTFSATALAWVEAGGIWAVANIRGGDEEGEEWHRQGMRGEKQNVFDDFIYAAKFLIDNRWTSAEKLAIEGGSNGGLLVGAALTQRPDLFAAVVCSAPLLDMIRYELHGLGATWSDEYGSASVEEEFEWLIGYSPYHQVRKGESYPATLFTVFEGDTRVDPLHARKMCAELQYSQNQALERPILIRAERNVGHGSRSLTRTIDLTSDSLAFISRWTGLSNDGGMSR